jgi:integrase
VVYGARCRGLGVGVGVGVIRMSTGLGLPVWHGGQCCRSTWRQIVLQYSPKFYGGFFLTDPKAGSAGTVDLEPVVAVVLAEHRRTFPPVAVDLVDIRSGEPVPRSASLLFTTTHGNPFTDRTWSREWARWGDAAGWPKEHGGFHALRHFFATTLITNHAEPQEVQRLLRA